MIFFGRRLSLLASNFRWSVCYERSSWSFNSTSSWNYFTAKCSPLLSCDLWFKMLGLTIWSIPNATSAIVSLNLSACCVTTAAITKHQIAKFVIGVRLVNRQTAPSLNFKLQQRKAVRHWILSIVSIIFLLFFAIFELWRNESRRFAFSISMTMSSIFSIWI